MKPTLLSLVLIFSFLITPLQSIHSATTTDNTALIQKLLAQIVILQAELNKLIEAKGGNTTTSTCTFTRTLREGTQGTDVTCLQTYLKKKGHFNGTATGFYGSVTRDAVYKWQQSAGIVPEPKAIGMFGPRSQETLLREMRSTPSLITSNTGTQAKLSTPGDVLKNEVTKSRSRGGGGGSTQPNKETLKDIVHEVSRPTTTVPATISPATVVTTLPTIPTAPTVPTVPAVPVVPTVPAQPSNGVSWNSLCAQQGIFVCDDFSDASKLYGTRYAGTGNGASTPVISNGNLVFTIPTLSTGNVAGSYTMGFPSSVGQGQFLAFSYRIKADRNAIELNAPGRKEFILWRGASSCTDLQVSISHQGYGNKYLMPYTECGATGFGYDLPTGDIQLHYPDYDCKYRTVRAGDISKCAISNADAWDTYYIEIQIGTYGQPNSKVVMWQKVEGGTWKRFVDTSTFTFRGSGGFHNFMLTTYMTSKSGAVEHPTAIVKYDHLIMSTKPFNVDQFLSATGNAPASTVVSSVPSVPTEPTAPTVPAPITGGITLVNFGGTADTNTFGLQGWSTVIKDTYTTNQEIGPAGTTITSGSNASYNHQGVRGPARTFTAGEKIVVTWYNNATTPITFTPKISFTEAGRYTTTGSWYLMTSVTVPSKGTATSEYTVTSATAGSRSLVNINTNYTGTTGRIAVADRIDLIYVGGSVPVPVEPVVPAVPTTTVPTSPVTTAVPKATQTSLPTPPAPSANPSASLVSQIGAVPEGQWKKISADNRAEDVDPGKDPTTNSRFPENPWYNGATGFKSLFQAWNSGGYAPKLGTCGTLVYFGAGHNDYWGNAVIGLDLCGGKNGGPLWKRLTNPYDPKMSMPWPFPTGAFPDGTPSPPHTYDGLAINPDNSSMFLTVSQGCYTQGGSGCGDYKNEYVSSAWILDIPTRTWYGPLQNRGGQYAGSAWDSKRKVFWFQPDGQHAGEFASFEPTSKTFTYYGKPTTNTRLNFLDHVMGYDPVNDVLLETNFRGGNGQAIGERSLANLSSPWKEVVQINKPTSLNGQNALAWSSVRNAWIVWVDLVTDGKVYELKRTGVSASGIPEYTWKLLTDSANTIIPITTTHNGGFEKFQIVNIGGSEVLIGQMRAQDDIYAFKIPTTGITKVPSKVLLTNAEAKQDLLKSLLEQLQVLLSEMQKLKN